MSQVVFSLEVHPLLLGCLFLDKVALVVTSFALAR